MFSIMNWGERMLRQLRQFAYRILRPRIDGLRWMKIHTENWCRQDFEAVLAESMRVRYPNDWFTEYVSEAHERRRLDALLRSTYHSDQALGRAIHMSDLETKNRRLRAEVRRMQLILEERNKEANGC